MAAARIPNQRDVHMGRGDDVREATTNALAACQQHAKDTAELVAKAVRNLQKGEETFTQWKAEVGPVTVEEFIAFGKNCVQPGYDYFRKLYVQEQGKLHNLYMALKGAEIFDPLKVKDMTEAATMLQADLLQRFGFPEFTDAFIAGLKEEIPRYRRMARAFFDWSTMEGAEEYEKQRRRRLEAREHDPTLRIPEYKRWEDDPAERARRIWLWWRIRVYEVQEFQFITLALRLVALVQPSSCGIERVFSQLKLILDACDDNVLESTLQCRLFERCGSTGFPLHVELH
jgi:hypothetical protein